MNQLACLCILSYSSIQCKSAHPTTHLFSHQPSFCPSILSLFIYPPTHASLHQPIYLSVHPSILYSIHPIPSYPSIYPSIQPIPFYRLIYSFIQLLQSIHQSCSIHPSFYQSICLFLPFHPFTLSAFHHSSQSICLNTSIYLSIHPFIPFHSICLFIYSFIFSIFVFSI